MGSPPGPGFLPLVAGLSHFGRPTIGRVTEPGSQSTTAQARAVRRIALAGVVAVALAAVGALVLSLRDSEPSAVPAARSSRLFPLDFREPGFVAVVVRRSVVTDRPPSTTRLTLSADLPTGAVGYVVARCDAGTNEVVGGSVSSGGACTASPRGIVVVQA
ncbi:MAG: hypothetical protein QOJ03_1333, partial [Frankiaceae bacterium]|nr:hypothetical protein [Frankiaceae bacterium]